MAAHELLRTVAPAHGRFEDDERDALMDPQVQQALEQGGVIDITTVGRTSGRAHRIEMWFHYLDGRLYITGLPGRRDWYANMVANPEFTFHLKGGVVADLPASARPIVDLDERRAVLGALLPRIGRPNELATWVEHSPLVEVTIVDR